jgi:hypothetical protein
MKLSQLQKIVEALVEEYAGSTQVEFSVEGDEAKLELAHVNHYREITTAIHPPGQSCGSQADTIFMVFRQ